MNVCTRFKQHRLDQLVAGERVLVKETRGRKESYIPDALREVIKSH